MLKRHYTLGHAAEFILVEGALVIVGRKVLQHFGKSCEYPAITTGPEILFARRCLMLGVYIFAVAEIKTGLGVIHYAVALGNVLKSLVKILLVACDFVQFGHHRHHHVQTVGPVPVVVIGS